MTTVFGRSRRIVVGVVAIVVVVVLGAAYLTWVAIGGAGPAAAGAVSGDLLFVELADGRNRVERIALADPGGERTATGLDCMRVDTAAGHTVCLRLDGIGPTYAGDVLDADGTVLRTFPLAGVPSRARLSASGQVVSWTAFVSGDSYSVPGGFSTRTGVLDLRTGVVEENLETFAAEIDGQPHSAVDVNLWGVTVAADDRTFYATLASGGRTWLVQGDLVARTVRSLRRDAECPSLSPDGTRVAYKKRIGRFGPWDLAVLDLATSTEIRLPGTSGIDDQAQWLDDGRLAFAGVPRDARLAAVLTVPADGSAPAQVLVPEATSPSVVR